MLISSAYALQPLFHSNCLAACLAARCSFLCCRNLVASCIVMAVLVRLYSSSVNPSLRSFRLILRRLGLSPCRILEKRGIHSARGQMNVSYDGSTDEHILCRAQMRPPDLIHRLCVVQLDVQVLVHALQCATDLDFILEFDSDLVLDERLEETRSLSAQYY
jgi:hypothetical protein